MRIANSTRQEVLGTPVLRDYRRVQVSLEGVL